MRVFIPLTIRKRNGRPKILPPADMIPTNDGGVDPHVLKAIEGRGAGGASWNPGRWERYPILRKPRISRTAMSGGC
jgi:hypothetical protein